MGEVHRFVWVWVVGGCRFGASVLGVVSEKLERHRG